MKNSQIENKGLFEALYSDLSLQKIKTILKKRKIEINKKNIYNQYPLNYALENLKNPEIIKMLLKNGANPLKKTPNKNSSIKIALKKKWDHSIIKLLIEKKI